MGTAFVNAWTLRQQAAYFGTQSFASSVTFCPDEGAPITTEAVMVKTGEQPYAGNMDRTVATGRALLNKADVTLSRTTAGHYGYIVKADGTQWAVTRVRRENDAFYEVDVQWVECDATGTLRERGK